MSLLNYCNTERQAEIVNLFEQGINQTEIGRQLGITRETVKSTLKTIRVRAAKQGYSPAHDMVHTVPDGYKVKGVSTYYNDEGQPVGQWVKSQADEKRQLEIMLERLGAAMDSIPRFTPTPMPHQTDDNLLSLLTITDFHLGMYAWEAETGDAWDVDIARQVFLDSVHKMIQGSPKSEVGVLCQLGDFLHWDGMLAITPTSSHILDADTRYGKLVE
ncbi:MAG: sigma factor-like helix-turn-helix DNA-binding protein, partial [Opitutae bacterium]